MFRYFVLLYFLFSIPAQAEFKVPGLTGPIVDRAGVISHQDEKALNQVILDLFNMGRAQLVILTLPSLEGESIESIGIKVADQWKLGTKEKDNGLILIVSLEEKKLRIEVGQGLEGDLPDVVSKRIIEDIIVPVIRSSGVSLGVVSGVYSIAQVLEPGRYKDGFTPPTRTRRSQFRLSEIFIYLIIFVGFIIISAFQSRIPGARRGRLYGGGGYSGGGWGSSGGGGGGFGGFSGGGGGFSGGGASGGW